MRIKICGIFRSEDIDFVNEAQPDYIGFVFAKSSRQVSAPLAQHLRFRLADGIVPVGVFVNAPITMVTELYHNGIISAAQLHGTEDDSYITQLKKLSEGSIREKKTQPIKVIKTVFPSADGSWLKSIPAKADYLLIDSGAGSGKTFDWKKLSSVKFRKPWFLAGGISAKNVKEAMTLNPFAIDVSSGAETDGIKDREKILQFVKTVKGNI